ncbi:MAG: uroporphyrinogen-III synthase [bacterium]
MSRPLARKTVVVTRAVEQADEFITPLKNAGAAVIHIPTIAITEPDSWESCDAAIAHLREYDWLVFTSTNGVRFFVQHLQAKGKKIAGLRTKRIAAVGRRTEMALSRLGIKVDVVPEYFSARGLVESFQNENLTGKKFLIAKAQKGSDLLEAGLKAKGASVNAVAVYKTQAPRMQNLTECVNGQRIDLLTFTSPSTFRNFVSAFGKETITAWKRNGCAIAAIGSVTAAAIAKYDFNVDILPRESTIASLVEAISEYYH